MKSARTFMPSFPIIPGYTCIEELHTSSRTTVYRAVETETARSVIVKLLQQNHANVNDLLQFRNQYAILRGTASLGAKNLDIPGIVRPTNFIPNGNSYALIFEDFNGISLKKYARERTLSLLEVLKIAIQLAQILHNIHQACIIHKDIKPSNILIEPATQQIQLIDFGIASLLPKETTEIETPNVLEGTLAYIAPEQTGRMNRGLDYRADFYAMGVTLFELLTQQLPFQSDDPLELVHCHLAKNPPRVDSISPEISPAIADIIYKLMAKNTEDRYQTALGIKHDLEQCLTQLQTTGTVKSFAIAQRDICDRFPIPEKLYGRNKEVQELLSAFDRVSAGRAEMMLVAGFSGIGKTALINEIHKPLVRQRGYFIKGKYEQYQRNIPFSALVQAFRDLTSQLLSESDEQLQAWKTQILKAVGKSGQLLIDVIPELETIIGEQPPVPELLGVAARNRFNVVFEKFLKVFTQKKHPLVLFIDDLQWLDSSSLDLLELLLKNQQYLLLLGAYRDNEVSPDHPLIKTVEKIARNGARVNTITLSPLSFSDLNQFIADTLQSTPTLAEPLTQLIHQKTQGNPFFASQFLKFLYEEAYITFNWDINHWQCDIMGVTALTLPDDIVEFVATRLRKIPTQTQEILKLAACIGPQFDLNTLAIVSESTSEAIASHLWFALQEELVIPVDKNYKFFVRLEEEKVLKVSANATYRFLHDRIQQAAYSAIPPSQQQQFHYRIGQLLQQKLSETEKEERLFDIVGHLNLSLALIERAKDRESLARLNLSAAQKAKNATASKASYNYLKTGLSLLRNNCWQSQYDLTLKLSTLAAEAAYLNGNFEEAEALANRVLNSAGTALDKVKIYEVQINAKTTQGQMLDAIAIGRIALGELEVEFVTQPNQSTTERVLKNTAQQLQNREIEALIDLPLMTDERTIAAMELLALLYPPVFFGNSALLPLLCTTMVNLSLKFGNTSASVVGYVGYGIVLCNAFADVERSYQFSKLALSLCDRLKAQKFRALTLLLFTAFIQYRKESICESILTSKEGYLVGMESGNFLFAGYSIASCFSKYFFSGISLDESRAEMSKYEATLKTLQQSSPLIYFGTAQQAMANLQEQVSCPDVLIGQAYDETVMMPKHLQSNEIAAIAVVYTYKMILAYYFGDYDRSFKHMEEGQSYVRAAAGIIQSLYYNVYTALIYLSAARSQLDLNERLDRVNSCQTILQTWAHHAPQNYQHHVELIEAEKYRVLGKNSEASDYYDRAIAGAKTHHFTQDEALASELAAKFYLAWGKERIAAGYFQDAYDAYIRWNARGKIAHLEQNYPQFLGSKAVAEATTIDGGDLPSLSSTNEQSQRLDLKTITQAARNLSSEIVFDKSIAQLMALLIENAGAQRGILILVEGDAWKIEATGEMTDILTAQAISPLPLEESQNLPLSIIQYVQHAQSEVVVADARYEERYRNDPYILQAQPRSILAAPILNQGKIVGIFYLENNLVTNAFTPARLEVLQILASQAAISLENARLYRTLEQKVKERTEQLATANEEITLLNQRLKQENLRMSAELDVVKQLQQMVLPKTEELEVVKDLDIAGFMQPADEVGGDYYDVLQDEDGVKIAIGDVTGHGLESGVLMMMAQTAVQTLQQSGERDPARFFDILNRTLYANIDRLKVERSMTLATLDYRDGEFWLSGQHEEAIIARANGEMEIIDTLPLGFPLGLEEEISDFVAAESFILQPGDALVLYSDGITEAENGEGKLYGQQRLYDVVQEHRALAAAEIRDAIVANVRQYIGSHKVWDDITLVVVKKRG
ncbi:AAA family ATPase [Oscillatoria sp. FACHB-1406]|uniref:AAA family ATPase n=1 Tax=Oscillatoria sp. FACHB-1406 TaxID=2692846 RepID=UPI001682D7F1|nr:AAA family ATPase [Oscillatoria sp. FACHB-1406]MBD2578156.1 AAA family ATPase [Oscillatoria sp. FACHB-1406]